MNKLGLMTLSSMAISLMMVVASFAAGGSMNSSGSAGGTGPGIPSAPNSGTGSKEGVA